VDIFLCDFFQHIPVFYYTATFSVQLKLYLLLPIFDCLFAFLQFSLLSPQLADLGQIGFRIMKGCFRPITIIFLQFLELNVCFAERLLKSEMVITQKYFSMTFAHQAVCHAQGSNVPRRNFQIEY